MTDPTINSAIVIPARNELSRIARCLQALAIQNTRHAAIVVVANGCQDNTAAVSRTMGNALGLTLDVLDCTFAAGSGVGSARRIGFAHALAAWPGATALLTTDADCEVGPDWIGRNLFHLVTADGVCGLVEPMKSELSVLDDMDISSAEMEGHYETLVQSFYRKMRPGLCGLEGDHGGAAGASLALRADAYRAIGGFDDMPTGEDRDLVRRLKTSGFGVRHAGDVRVAASCRLDGRATGGMSDALRARVQHTDYLIDEALPPANMLIDAAMRGDLGPWPPHVAPHHRLRARDLAPHIARLEAALSALVSPSSQDLASAHQHVAPPSLPHIQRGERL